MINDLSTPIRFLLFFLRVCMIGRGHELPRHTSGVPFNSWFLQRTSDFRIGWLKRHVSRTFTSEAQVRNLSENSGVTVLLYARYRIIARLRLLVSSAFSLLPFFIFCLGEGRARSTLHDFYFWRAIRTTGSWADFNFRRSFSPSLFVCVRRRVGKNSMQQKRRAAGMLKPIICAIRRRHVYTGGGEEGKTPCEQGLLQNAAEGKGNPLTTMVWAGK